jgi:hypothetical protein
VAAPGAAARQHDQGPDRRAAGLTGELADQVRDPPEHERAGERASQRHAVEDGQPAGAEMAVVADQGRGDPDDEQVIGISP